MEQIQKILLIIGILIILISLSYKYVPLGKLPGDFTIGEGNFKIYIPITSMIIFSVILTIILVIFRFFNK